MDTDLAWHHTRLLAWLVGRASIALFVGTLVALIVGAVGWAENSTGWVVASPAFGLLTFAVLMVTFSPPLPASLED